MLLQRKLILCLVAAFVFSPSLGLAEEKANQAAQNLSFSSPMMEDIAKREWSGTREDGVVEVLDSGLSPQTLEMQIRQGILFFYNNTKDSKIKFEIDYGKNAMVCYSSATPNLAFKEGGKLVSTRPVEPGNFASTCFPNVGTYSYRVFGVNGSKAPLEGKIVVSPKGQRFYEN